MKFCVVCEQTMDQSLLSLTYKGSIPEAITEAKKQRKLFVVYISGALFLLNSVLLFIYLFIYLLLF